MLSCLRPSLHCSQPYCTSLPDAASTRSILTFCGSCASVSTLRLIWMSVLHSLTSALPIWMLVRFWDELCSLSIPLPNPRCDQVVGSLLGSAALGVLLVECACVAFVIRVLFSFLSAWFAVPQVTPGTSRRQPNLVARMPRR